MSAPNPQNAAPPLLEDALVTEHDLRLGDKNIKQGRIWLYLLSVLQAGLGIYVYLTQGGDDADLALIIELAVAAVFLGCAIWSYRNPTPAFVTALICYVLVHTVVAIDDPTTILRGIILKVCVIIGLVKACKNARDNDLAKRDFGIK
ncbi:MAG: hypothetical protein EAY75_02705 [Bacteroidetes bacterium]|nr:MAG: hypothetical protein EAY75_02705 [Bacteroidota bacterium]